MDIKEVPSFLSYFIKTLSISISVDKKTKRLEQTVSNNIVLLICVIELSDLMKTVPYARGGTPIHYLYGYVPPKGVVILKLLI